ncbi:MAG: RNA-binding protein [Bacteroidales bacterium]|nr:RNA-binding protein [Bacteroidales bacterium]
MNIYVSNLNYKVDSDGLMQLFEGYGEISSARVIMDRFTGKSRGFGFVEMPDDAAAQKAIEELNQAEHEGNIITVNEARPREERPRNNFGGGGGYNRGGYNNDRGGYSDRRGGGDNYNSDRRPRRW